MDKIKSSIASTFTSQSPYKLILIILVILGFLTLVMVQFGLSFNVLQTESFESKPTKTSKKQPIPAGCPVSAKRGQDGKIHVVYNSVSKPGQQQGTTELAFETLQDYVDYLNDLYKTENACVPPKVQNYRSPVMGVIGGIGTGTEDKDGIMNQSATRSVMDDRDSSMSPYSTSPINKLDDYEADFIYENERGSRTSAMSKAAINQLTEKYKFDWSQLPFSSEPKAIKEDNFLANRLEDVYKEPSSGTFFRNVNGDGMTPPNVDEREMKERSILNTYKPPQTTKENQSESELSTVGKLIKRLFASDKDYIPVVEKTGPNKYEVTEYIPKHEQQIQEDHTTLETAVADGLIPNVQIFDSNRTDPYFSKTGVADKDNNRFWRYQDFQKWTPGLERMFAPTFDQKDWY